MSYINEFLSLKCSSDVIAAVGYLGKNPEKEISESMAIIKQLKKFVLKEPFKYTIYDMCAGNALTSVIAAHLLPVKSCIAFDIKERKRRFDLVRKFSYVTMDINRFKKENFPFDENLIIISSHPCKMARTVSEIYTKYQEIKAMVMIPCCQGPLKRKYPTLIESKLNKYLVWSWDLAQDVEGDLFIDTKCLSSKNAVIVASKGETNG
jgi:hypothetical protein